MKIKLEDIKYLEKQIEIEEKRLKKLQEKGIDKNVIKSTRLNIINMQEELLQNEQELKFEQLKQMKDSLKARLDKGTINEDIYYANIRDVDNMQRVVEICSDINNLQMNIKRDKVLFDYNQDDRYSQKIEDTELEVEDKKNSFSKSVKLFLKGFTLHQLQQGYISDEKRKEILLQKELNLEDVDMMFENLSTSMYGSQQRNDVMTTDLAQKALPKCDIKNISCIDDYVTKSQLCQLYQINNTDDIQIFAIHNFNHTTIGEAMGMTKEGYTRMYDDNNYDKEMGDAIGLYCFNKKTGKLEQMQSEIPVQCISTGRQVDVANINEVTKEDEISTMSYAGLNLTFYTGENGKLCIARNINGTLQEVSTETLEHMDRVAQMQERIKSLQPEENRELPDINEAINADNYHEKVSESLGKDYKELFQKVRDNVAEASKKVPLQNKNDAAKEEKLDREHIENRRGRLI